MLGELSALNEILEAYIKELGTIDAKVEGRITVKEVPETKPAEEPKPVEEQAQQSIPPAVEEAQQPIPPIVKEKSEEQVAAAVADDVYVVKPNDILWKIAEKFGLTWQKLAEYNRLKNPHLIFPGQKLLIPAN